LRGKPLNELDLTLVPNLWPCQRHDAFGGLPAVGEEFDLSDFACSVLVREDGEHPVNRLRVLEVDLDNVAERDRAGDEKRVCRAADGTPAGTSPTRAPRAAS
jgi:hypothetical protein